MKGASEGEIQGRFKGWWIGESWTATTSEVVTRNGHILKEREPERRVEPWIQARQMSCLGQGEPFCWIVNPHVTY